MRGTYAHDWKPSNLGGTIYYDPQQELTFWANVAIGDMVAVPVATLRAAAARRDCGARTIARGDEDGPYREPIEISCFEQRDHAGRHSNGHTTWESR